MNNLLAYAYWSSTAVASMIGSAWGFYTFIGSQNTHGQPGSLAAWAVRPATAIDVAAADPVPEPKTYAMLLAGVGLLGVAARRRRYFGA